MFSRPKIQEGKEKKAKNSRKLKNGKRSRIWVAIANRSWGTSHWRPGDGNGGRRLCRRSVGRWPSVTYAARASSSYGVGVCGGRRGRRRYLLVGWRRTGGRKETVRVGGSALVLALAVGLGKADSRVDETWPPARDFWGSRGSLALDAEGERGGWLWPRRWWVAVAAHGGRRIIPLHGHGGVRVSYSRCASGPLVSGWTGLGIGD